MRESLKRLSAVVMAAAACLIFDVGSYGVKPISALTLIADIKEVKVDKSVISVGESTQLSVEWNYGEYNWSAYIYSSDENVVKVSNSSVNGCTLTGVSAGTAEITVNNTPYSKTIEVEVISDIKGDVNADGEFNIADIVLFQKWLLACPDVELKNWKAADLCKDDRLDVFDMVMLRRELIKVMNDNTQVTDSSFKLQNVTEIRDGNEEKHSQWLGFVARSENELKDILAENEYQPIDAEIDSNVFKDKSVIVIYSMCRSGNSYSIIDSVSLNGEKAVISTETKKPKIATPDMMCRRYIYLVDKNVIKDVNSITFGDNSSFYEYEESNDVLKWFNDWVNNSKEENPAEPVAPPIV